MHCGHAQLVGMYEANTGPFGGPRSCLVSSDSNVYLTGSAAEKNAQNIDNICGE